MDLVIVSFLSKGDICYKQNNKDDDYKNQLFKKQTTLVLFIQYNAIHNK